MKPVAKPVGTARRRRAVTPRRVAPLAMVLALCSNLGLAEETWTVEKPAPVAEAAPGRPAANAAPTLNGKPFNLPGLEVNFQERCVDLEGSICLDEGYLELVACTKGSKEHESVVAIEARPMHIHAALLLLGADPGNPAMRKPIDEQKTRWIVLPPKGDPVDVYLVVKNKEGKRVEHPIGDFITRSGKGAESALDAGEEGAGEDRAFPRTFVFAGSRLHGDGPGPRKYLSDLSGNVISISSFGDEVLCLPGLHSQANGSLVWRVDATELPAVGSKVILRLRPQNRVAPKAGETSPED